MPKDSGQIELDWRGKIALEHVGSDTFNHEFHLRYDRLVFSGIKLPKDVRESDALSLLAPYFVDVERLKPTVRDGSLWLATG